MVVLVVLVTCILLAGLRRLATHTSGVPNTDAPRPLRSRSRGSVAVDAVTYPDRVQDRWTALDDRQLTRLLDDSAPC